MINTILFAVDGSDESERAIPVVVEVAERFASEVVVFHVRERYETSSGVFQTGSDKIADTIARKIKDAGVSARPEMVTTRGPHRSVAKRIVDASNEIKADLVVMGSRGLGEISELLLGSTTQQVLHLIRGPVLVLR